ncbi:unnamed protein product, partial [Polarella glacialis]
SITDLDNNPSFPCIGQLMPVTQPKQPDSPRAQDAARHSAREALSALDARRDEFCRSRDQMLDAVAGLRQNLAAVRAAVRDAGIRIQGGCGELQELAGEADRHFHASGPDRAALAEAERDVRELERRAEILRLEEGEKRRSAEVELAAAALELDALTKRAEEAERLEGETELAAAAALPALQAQLAAEEQALQEELDLEAEVTTSWRPSAGEAEGGLDPDEQLCFEWYHMLREDKPHQAALALAEAECDSWEMRLHALVAPPAFRLGGGNADSGTGRAGLQRLDAELLDLTAAERGRRSDSAECLQVLSQEGPGRLIFSEIHE